MSKKDTKKDTEHKWFVVATEGATTDGRAIQRSWIEQMAKNYDPKTYGARINLEHIQFYLYAKDQPHSQCYGDVLALKTEEKDGKLQLLAQIDPTDALIALNKDRQKIYTSIEVDPNFADTGEAYLVGLAVTDSPASLGTEMLQFASHAQMNPLASRKQKADNLFTAALETEFNFAELADAEPEKPSLFEKIKAMFANKERNQEQRFADQDKAVLLLSERLQENCAEITALSAENQALQAQFSQIQSENQAILAKFEQVQNEPKAEYSERPKALGGNGKDGYKF